MNIFLPIETINREIDYKLVLGCLLANKEAKVYIGQHDYLLKVAKGVSGGIYIGKTVFRSAFPTELGTYNFFKSRGFIIIHLDEEGAFYLGKEKEWEQALGKRLNPLVLGEEDYICTWGEFQARYYSRIMSQEGKEVGHITVTGHPRFDLYKSKWRSLYVHDVSKIKNIYGRYILINTNFSIANNNFGITDSFSPRLGYLGNHSESSNNLVKRWGHTMRLLSAFIELVHELSTQNESINIIVRPHPSESDDFYKIVLRGLSNVFVVHEGPVSPWIIGAEYIIHDGCTTAIESYFAGKNVILFKPVEDERLDQYIPNLIGRKCTTVDEVIACLNTPAEDVGNTISDELALSMFENFRTDTSFEKLTTIIEQAEKSIGKIKYYNRTMLFRINMKNRAVMALKSLFKFLSSDRKRLFKAHKKKFYGFDIEHTNTILNAAEDIINKKVALEQHSSNLIIISAKGSKTKQQKTDN